MRGVVNTTNVSSGVKKPPQPQQPHRRTNMASYAPQTGQVSVTFQVDVPDIKPKERLYMVGGKVSTLSMQFRSAFVCAKMSLYLRVRVSHSGRASESRFVPKVVQSFFHSRLGMARRLGSSQRARTMSQPWSDMVNHFGSELSDANRVQVRADRRMFRQQLRMLGSWRQSQV